jgi:hypothetical protein
VVFTDAQRKALRWLTPGYECGGAPREVSAAIGSLRLYHPDLVTRKVETNERGGQRWIRYKLTEAGIAARAKVMS